MKLHIVATDTDGKYEQLELRDENNQMVCTMFYVDAKGRAQAEEICAAVNGAPS